MLEPPTPLFSEGEVETQGKEAEGALWEGGEVPDVEYGPPTAIGTPFLPALLLLGY